MELEHITSAILNAAVALHRALGPGLMESVYEAILARELQERGLRVRRQQAVRFTYKNITFDEAFRADLIVEDCVIIELKAVARLEPVFSRQLLTYVKLLQFPVGLLINFGGATLKEGIKRIVNDHPLAISRGEATTFKRNESPNP